MRNLHAANRDDESETGFTLIELMIVVLIIGILIAVLIPTFAGARQRAQDRAMQTSMRNALTAANIVYSDHGDFTEATVAGLTAVEPSLTWVDAGSISLGPNVISVDPVSSNYIVLAGQARSTDCFFVSDDMSAGGAGVRYAKNSSGSCSASGAPAPSDPSWGPTW